MSTNNVLSVKTGLPPTQTIDRMTKTQKLKYERYRQLKEEESALGKRAKELKKESDVLKQHLLEAFGQRDFMRSEARTIVVKKHVVIQPYQNKGCEYDTFEEVLG